MILHRSGIGQWAKPAPVVPGPCFEFGDSGDGIKNFQAALRDYG
jgi:hypothetical protein